MSSDPEIYLGRVRRSPPKRTRGTRDETRPLAASDAPTLRSHGDDLIAEALGIAVHSGSPPQVNPALEGAIAIASKLAAVDHFETHCGFGVRGADVVGVLGLGCTAEIVNPGVCGGPPRAS